MSNDTLVVVARRVSRDAVCPGGGIASGRVHGRYRRRLADLAVAGREVVVDLQVQRYLCKAAQCNRRSFVEQVDGLTERFGRRTPPMRRTPEKLALALAGRPAAPLAAHLSMPTSANSLLRLLRAAAGTPTARRTSPAPQEQIHEHTRRCGRIEPWTLL